MTDSTDDLTMREKMVFLALAELERGDWAESGRDYGRGIAFACQLIRDRIAQGEAAQRTLARAKLAAAADLLDGLGVPDPVAMDEVAAEWPEAPGDA